VFIAYYHCHLIESMGEIFMWVGCPHMNVAPHCNARTPRGWFCENSVFDRCSICDYSLQCCVL